MESGRGSGDRESPQRRRIQLHDLSIPATVELSDSDIARFWAKVNKTETCWEWTGALRGGYGRFKIGNVLYSAHRIAWQLENGDLEDHVVLDHGEMCSNRKCVRPGHLQVVPLAVNTARSNERRGWNCGHPRVPENIYTTRDGIDGCRTCRFTRKRRKRG